MNKQHGKSMRGRSEGEDHDDPRFIRVRKRAIQFTMGVLLLNGAFAVCYNTGFWTFTKTSDGDLIVVTSLVVVDVVLALLLQVFQE